MQFFFNMYMSRLGAFLHFKYLDCTSTGVCDLRASLRFSTVLCFLYLHQSEFKSQSVCVCSLFYPSVRKKARDCGIC